MKNIFLTILYLVLAASAYAQVDTIVQIDPIATDRPDQTESASLVPKGYLQMEIGFGLIDGDPGKAYVYPNALLKYGVNENFELRFIGTYTTLKDDGQANINGFLPFALGFKTKFTEENGIWPKISLLGHFVLPGVVTEDLAVKNLAPDLRFAFQHSISDFFSLGYNLGVFWDGDNPEPYFIYSVAPGFSVGNFGFYVEGYGFIPQNTDRAVRFLADAGVTYLVNNDFQLDVSFGNNLTNNIVESYIALGFSYRFKV